MIKIHEANEKEQFFYQYKRHHSYKNLKCVCVVGVAHAENKIPYFKENVGELL